MKKPLLVLIVALGLMRPVWADFQDGLAAYERGDYATALREFRPLAEQGYAGAQHNLALMYYSGHGVPQDYGEARRWYRRAAEQGDANAQFNLGFMYYSGHGVPQDYADGRFDIQSLVHEPANRNDFKAVGVVDEEGTNTLKTTLHKSIGAEVRIIRT